MRILIVEDNAILAGALREGLIQRGFRVDATHRGREGEELALSGAYDLVVLDVMLPDGDGIAVCRTLRRQNASCFVLMLTCLSATHVKVAALEAGADDFLVKPFEFDELVARVRALLRRGVATEATRLGYEDVELDLLRRRARRGGRPLHLRPRELSLLELFLRNPERVVDRTTIAERIWDRGEEPSSNAIDKCLSTLRSRLDRGFPRALIHTVVGQGYRLSAGEPEG